MKFQYTVDIDIPDENIRKFADECDAPFDLYVKGLRESIWEELEIYLHQYKVEIKNIDNTEHTVNLNDNKE